MSDEVKKSETFTFEENGKEYKVDDLSDDNKVVFGKLKLINNQINELTFNANNELEKLNILRQHYGDLLQKAVEEPVVETVTKEVK
jgi:hypothetical protein